MTHNFEHSWFTVNKLSNDLWSIDDIGFDLSYLITGSDRALLIDTGLGIGNIRAIAEELTTLPLLVVNTHAHPDHAGGDDQFPEVHLHHDDARLLNVIFTRKIRENAYSRGKILMEKKKIELRDIPEFDLERWINAKPNTIIPVTHGDTFDLGNRKLEVFSMPGHTPGSVVIVDKEKGRIFGGDSIIQRHPVWLHLDESAPLHQYRNALEKLCDISTSFSAMYSSHMNEPIEPSLLTELLETADSILSGTEKGKYFRTHAGEGLILRHKRAGIIYREDNL